MRCRSRLSSVKCERAPPTTATSMPAAASAARSATTASRSDTCSASPAWWKAATAEHVQAAQRGDRVDQRQAAGRRRGGSAHRAAARSQRPGRAPRASSGSRGRARRGRSRRAAPRRARDPAPSRPRATGPSRERRSAARPCSVDRDAPVEASVVGGATVLASVGDRGRRSVTLWRTRSPAAQQVRERQRERAAVRLERGIRPVALVFHLEHVAGEGDGCLDPVVRPLQCGDVEHRLVRADRAREPRLLDASVGVRHPRARHPRPGTGAARPGRCGSSGSPRPRRHRRSPAGRLPTAVARTVPRTSAPNAAVDTATSRNPSAAVTESTVNAAVFQSRSRTTARMLRSTRRPSNRTSASSSSRSSSDHGPLRHGTDGACEESQAVLMPSRARQSVVIPPSTANSAPGRERAVVGREEHHDPLDVVRRSRPAQRNAPDDGRAGLRVGGDGRHERRLGIGRARRCSRVCPDRHRPPRPCGPGRGCRPSTHCRR